MRLRELQRAFRSHLMHGDPAIRSEIAASPDGGAERKLGVYAHAYRARLLEALATDFPKLRLWLGEDAFDACCTAYVDAHPSRHPSLRWLGRQLGSFLRVHPPYAGHPALAEMADFEWAQGLVFDAPDGTRLRVESLAAVPPEHWWQLRFEARASLQRLDLHWNVPGIWKALDAGQPPPDPVHAPEPFGWLLWRKGFEVHWRSLDPAERSALDSLRGGGCLADIMQALAASTDEAQLPERAAGLLRQWIADDLLGSCSPTGTQASRADRPT